MTAMCLRAEKVVVVRGGRRILDGASFEVAASSITTIQGASGSGKSTFLRVVASLVEPDEGSLWLQGIDARTIAPEIYRRRVAYVAQTPQMLDGTVSDNVKSGPRFLGRDLDKKSIETFLERVVLDPVFATRSARDLSGGERVRVALARALANEPEVILLDEPTAALDPETGDRILELVRSLATLGKAIVVVTHSIQDAKTLGGTPWICKDGGLDRVQIVQ
jgi:putative ABC transport system ATP-binding protein